MAAKRMRVVKPGEQPAKPSKPQSVFEAASSGDSMATLVAMRDRVSKALSAEDCPPRDLSSLTRRLQEIIKDIDAKRAQDEQEAERRERDEGEDGDFDAATV